MWKTYPHISSSLSLGHVFGDTYLHNRAGVDFYLTYLHVAHMITYLHVPQHLGWGGDVTVLTTCTHGRCYATHGVGGWCYRSYNLHTWWMFRNNWGGGVMLQFLQLAHMVDVTQHLGWGDDVTVLTTCTHGGCSATHGVGGWCYRSCNLHTWSMLRNNWGAGVMLPFLQLAHMVDVPQHMGWGGDVAVLTTCTHGGCSFQKWMDTQGQGSRKE